MKGSIKFKLVGLHEISMWVRGWVIFSVISTLVTSQTVNNNFQQDGMGSQWGWQVTEVTSPTQAAHSFGQYYVKLPHSEQRVVYKADEAGYHGAVTVNTSDEQHVSTTQVALGSAVDLGNGGQIIPNEFQGLSYQAVDPVDIYLLQHISTPHHNPTENQPIREPYYNQIQPLYHLLTQDESKHTDGSVKREQIFTTPVVRVFKDHNCTDNDEKQETIPILKPINEKYNLGNLNGNFGKKKLAYRGSVNFKVEKPVTTTESRNRNGIKKLVEYTKDLITNEDLIRINNAVEQHYREQSDELIKPRINYNNNYNHNKNFETLKTSPTQITVTAKIGNIRPNYEHAGLKENISPNYEHLELLHNKPKVEPNLTKDPNYDQYVLNHITRSHNQPDSNEHKRTSYLEPYDNKDKFMSPHKFASPIIVADHTNDFNEQLVSSLVSTVMPYVEDGFNVVSVKKKYNDDYLSVTPRPIGPTYLAPFTVAVRLINSDNVSNHIEDHEGSDSEISPIVDRPKKHNTVVQVEKSVPLSITHINDVEIHEYLENGKVTTKPDFTKNTKANNKDLRDSLESNESVRREIEYGTTSPNGQKRSENMFFFINSHHNGFDYEDAQKLVQPNAKETQNHETKDAHTDNKQKSFTFPTPVDKPVGIAYDKLIEKPFEASRYSGNSYPLALPHQYLNNLKFPVPEKQTVYVDRPVHIPYPVEKIVEKIIEKPLLHHVAVPTPVALPIAVPVEHSVLYPIIIEKQVPMPIEVEKTVEKIIQKEVSVPYPVEKIVPYPIAYETKAPVPYPLDKRIPAIHPLPIPVPIHHSYPVEKLVEKNIPYPVHIDRMVDKEVKVPYPVESGIDKIVEKPIFIAKYIDRPYPVENQASYMFRHKKPAEKVPDRQTIHREEAPHNRIYNVESRNVPQYQIPAREAGTYVFQHGLHTNRSTHLNQQPEGPKLNNRYAPPFQHAQIIHSLNLGENKQLTNNFQNISLSPNPYWEAKSHNNKKDVNYVNNERRHENKRVPKIGNIEYGGFKPPLVPSIQVDFDGFPITNNKK